MGSEMCIRDRDKKAEEQIKAQKLIEQVKEAEKSSSTTISDDDGMDEFFG